MLSSQSDSTHLVNSRMVKLAQAGDAEAFTVLFEQYKLGIFGYIKGQIGNREEAADLTQKTFLRAWEKLPALNDVSRFQAWLYKIARNLVIDYRRLGARTPSFSLENLTEYNTISTQTNLEDETALAELVKLALAELTPKYRDCLLLQIEGGFSRDEIAELLKIDKDSVSTYIYNARRQFREVYHRLEQQAGAVEKRSPS